MSDINSADKTKIFRELSSKYPTELKLLIEGGKLRKEDGWGNVVEHSLIQTAAAEVLTDLLGLSIQAKRKIIKVALCHDWNKRMEVNPGDFTKEDKLQAKRLLQEVNPDTILMRAASSEFVEKALIKKRSHFLERVQFYLDEICMGSQIANIKERINEVEKRRKALNNDERLTRKLGGKYFNKVRESSSMIEQEIFIEFKKRDIQVATPEQIPTIIRNEIVKNLIR